MPDSIVVARTASDYEAFAVLIREYWDWLGARYADHPGLIDAVGSHQALDEELKALPTVYGPPQGKTPLADRDGQVSGGIAYHDLNDGSCEMKRLFVPDRFHGQGTGRQLCEALVATATTDGFRLMRLGTGYLNAEAIRMYESIGFRSCSPHHDYPQDLVPHLRFMEKSLASSSPT
jgi:GNAT superfamily N-acetyltransferase